MGTPPEKKCMHLCIKLHRVLGSWPQWNKKHRKRERIYYLWAMFTFGMLLAYILILVPGIKVFYKSWKTWDDLTEDVAMIVSGLLTAAKVLVIVYNQTTLDQMVKYINLELNEKEASDESDRSTIRDCIKHERTLAKTILICGYAITSVHTSSSLVKILKKRAAEAEYAVVNNEDFDDANNYTLPLKYPYKPNGFFMYLLTYFHQLFCMSYIGHCGTMPDVFFASLANYIAGHFEILRNRISREGLTEKLIMYHNKVLRLNEKLQSIFSTYLVLQIIVNTFMICMALLQMTRFNKNLNIFYYLKGLVYFLLKMMQLYLYCYYGQKIIDKSGSVFNEVYSGPWYLQLKNKRFAYNLIMVMRRTLKPSKIRGGNFFVMCLPTLAAAINRAYSFFALLTSFRE